MEPAPNALGLVRRWKSGTKPAAHTARDSVHMTGQHAMNLVKGALHLAHVAVSHVAGIALTYRYTQRAWVKVMLLALGGLHRRIGLALGWTGGDPTC